MFILAKRNKMKITFISDTHTKHHQVTSQLPGGDLLVHAGDFSSRGYEHEVDGFFDWFNKLDNYTNKIVIAGNHDLMFEDNPMLAKDIMSYYPNVTYLQDNIEVIGEDYQSSVKVYGSPWQPEFYNWAFNLPRNGEELKEKWNEIPHNMDIVVTHGPAYGHLDTVVGQSINLGCQLLTERLKVVKPKIHVCGHIHSGYGYKFDNGTHYINASVLGEDYIFKNKPLTVEWDPNTNKIEFLDY
jgi:Icc-related predicted phosphoesterase